MNSAAETVTLYIHYPNRRYVLAAARAEGTELSIFAPTQARMPVGAQVRLAIDFGDAVQRFVLNGKVSFLRGPRYGASEQLGLGIVFEGDDKRAAAEMLAFCAGRPLNQGTATKRRIATKIRCRVSTGKKQLPGHVLDLSANGAFISAPKSPGLKVGSELTVQLEPSFFGFGGRTVGVKVMWQGEKGGTYGFGARFVGDSHTLTNTISRYLKNSLSR